MKAIVNAGPDWGIGNHGALLWSIPDDLRRFQRLTSGGVVILGHKTLATFPGGRPLKNRVNLILSRQPGLVIPGATVFADTAELLQAVQDHFNQREIWVIGGSSIYRQLLPFCDTVELTRTGRQVSADTFFPDLDADSGWRQTDVSPLSFHEGIPFRYITYCRVR